MSSSSSTAGTSRNNVIVTFEEDPPPALPANHRTPPPPPPGSHSLSSGANHESESGAASLGFLDQTIEACKFNAVGLLGLEVWKFDQKSGNLVPVKPLEVFRIPQEADVGGSHTNQEAIQAYKRLTVPHLNHGMRRQQASGVGLCGILWTEASLSTSVSFRTGTTNDGPGTTLIRNARTSGKSDERIVWREVDAIASDPDQPHDSRVQSLAKAGFTLAAGVPFSVCGYRGLVVYHGNPHMRQDILRHPANGRFLRCQAALIGAAIASERPLVWAADYKAKVRNANWRRLKIKFIAFVGIGRSALTSGKIDVSEILFRQAEVEKRKQGFRQKSALYELQEKGVQAHSDLRIKCARIEERIKAKSRRWIKKIRGGDSDIPPAHNWTQCTWTFVGVFITHIILSRLNAYVLSASDGQLVLFLAPFGALSTLQYALTAAPASQPRNAFFSQCFALTTAIALSYIPNITPWFRTALAPAIVITGMAKLGIIHPPAGAAAIIFASGEFRWEHMGIFLVGVSIAIINSVIINNWSDKRQYPTSWHLVNRAKNKLIGTMNKQ